MMILQRLLKIRDTCVLWKVYLSRSLAYISIFNAILILFLAMTNLKQYGIELSLKQYFIPIIIFGTIVLVFFGYLEHKTGVLNKELELRSKFTPQFNTILKNQEEIKEGLKRLEK